MADHQSDDTLRVPIYYQEVVIHAEGDRTFRAYSFDFKQRVDVGRHNDLAERTFRESVRYGFIEAPPGSRMADLDGETVLILPGRQEGLYAEEVLARAKEEAFAMAEDEEIDGLNFTYRPA